MKLINLTPHTIVLACMTGERVEVESSGIARVTTADPGPMQFFEDVPVPVAPATVFGEIEGLPDPQGGVFYIVSALVGAALKGTRADVLQPGTGPKDEPIRNEKGHIVAVTRLVRS